MTDGLYGADRESILKRLDQLEAENQELRALVEALRNESHTLSERVDELEAVVDGGAS